jgi:hypothetical protein
VTRQQRRLVLKWGAVIVVLVLLVRFDSFIAENAAWLRWFAFVALIVASAAETRPGSESGRARLAATLAEAPWLTWWPAMWAVICFGGAIYISKSQYRLEEMFGFKIVVIALAVVVGPIILVNERRRYVELGKTNAI